MCYRQGPYCHSILSKRMRSFQKKAKGASPEDKVHERISNTQLLLDGTPQGQAELLTRALETEPGPEQDELATRIIQAAELRMEQIKPHLEPREPYTAGKNTHRGYAHEYLMARAIIEHSDNARFSQDEKQVALKEIRKGYADALREKSASEDMSIYEIAQEAAGYLPQAQGEVLFTETNANGGEVFDILYHDVDGKRIALSCKLSEMEDKSHRFSTADYRIPPIENLNRDMFSHAYEKGMSYEQALQEKEMTTQGYYDLLLLQLEETLANGPDSWRDTLLSLTSERFIGNGGYYKTLNNGGIRYYPTNEESDTLTLVPDSISRKGATITYRVQNTNAEGEVKQVYEIRARTKFKDGIKKPIKVSKDGSPGNISLSVDISLL